MSETLDLDAGEYVTVEEAADRLGKSVATVRRWSKNGTLRARKTGRQWLVAAETLPRTAASRGSRRQRLRMADFGRCLAHLKSLDLREVWVPDILHFEDHLAASEDVQQIAAARLASAGPFDPVIEVEVPKTPFFTRTGHLLSLEDRLAYQSAVESFAGRVEKLLPPSVYSARLSPSKGEFLLDGRLQWMRWMNHVIEEAGSTRPWMIKTDLAAYFDTIPLRLLSADIRALNPEPAIVGAMDRMLGEWSGHRGVGLPQGPNASRILANLYLAAVDHVMSDGPWDYTRYLDDIRILGASRGEAIAGLKSLERECKRKGLVISAKKTELLFGDKAIADCADESLSTAAYWWEERVMEEAQPRLRQIWTAAVPSDGQVNLRHAKFALWRLLQLRDTLPIRTLLGRLEDFAPIGDMVTIYLRPWLGRPRVMDGIAKFLEDPNRSTSPFFVTWLLAGAIDQARGISGAWVTYARRVLRDRNSTVYLRVVAANLLARHGTATDVQSIKGQLAAEYEPTVLRGFLVALARAGHLDAGSSRIAMNRAPILDRTVKYLKGRSALPALLTRGEVIGIQQD
jgi:excisionase family DNA binding protein